MLCGRGMQQAGPDTGRIAIGLSLRHGRRLIRREVGLELVDLSPVSALAQVQHLGQERADP